MNPLERLRKQIAQKRSKMDTMLSACDVAGGEIRDFTPDEQSAFDALVAAVKKLQDQVAELEAMGDGEEDREEEGDQEGTEEGRSRPAPAPAPTPAPGRGRRSLPIGQGPAVHTADRRYSLLRALRLNSERRQLDGIEGEVHQELARRRSQPAQGFLMPLGNEPEFRTHLYGRGAERRDLTTTSGAGGVFVLPELPFIELLRNKTVLKGLGARFLSGLEGKVSIPRQNGATTAYWVAEGVGVTPSNPTLDQVPLVDKTLGAMANISRKFMYQSSVDAEQFVKDDLSLVLAIALDAAGINGSGTGAIPLGILQNTAIQTASAGVQGGTNGAIPTFSQLVGMESQVANANADRGSLKYLTTPGLRGTLKTTNKSGSTFPVFLYEDGEVNGHPCEVSNQVPGNLTKGSAAAICHAIIYGNWEDLIIAMWGGIDILVNPYSNQATGAVTISMLMEADVAVRHVESFSIVSDAKTS